MEAPAHPIVQRFAARAVADEARDVPTFWIDAARIHEVLTFLKDEVERPYRMLYDLTAIDERMRRAAPGPPREMTVVYHLLSLERNQDVRLKVAVPSEAPAVPTATDIWPSASWYEREVWDMFGVKFDGHPDLRRILMPPTWRGHPLRKDHPARATEMGVFELPDERAQAEEEAMRSAEREPTDSTRILTLNLGPQHPGTHGVLRIVLDLDGERIVDARPDIGFHHRGAEKMGERQSWHTFIPYTDRIDYLGGVVNELPYLLAVEALAGIEVPDRAKVIRIMLCELFRIASHLVWYGTFAQDLGALSPVFYMFTDRERAFQIVEAICGARMHPGWFRIGGVAQDLPRGWDGLVREFCEHMPDRLREYDRMVMKNPIFQARTRGIGAYTTAQAIEWGVTGPGLRATGLGWDFRKKRPYGGYDHFEFDIPTAAAGDSYARAEVRVAEMWQSLRIIEQCVNDMPGGPVKADHPLATPPPKERALHDIEALITHFLGVSWGPVIPAGEAFCGVEATKGSNGYYLVSDGDVHPYRVRIRTPSFPHMQMLPAISRGLMVSDLVTILGSIDFVLADVDR
ncbi:MAG: NADH-quinone oxidoreductase subunit C/D [Deltaproteobacteria bacterium]|nr:NADH-quinone oxidoreductase subunit C/D [Deltaproteobacteria bacterium]